MAVIRLLSLLAAMVLCACASKPRPHLIAQPSCGTGWDDCAWQEVLSNA